LAMSSRPRGVLDVGLDTLAHMLRQARHRIDRGAIRVPRQECAKGLIVGPPLGIRGHIRAPIEAPDMTIA